MVVKTKAEARANFDAAVAYIPSRYEAGVAKADWLTPAKSETAEKNYADAVTKAVTDRARQKAIAAMTNEEWKSAAVSKGAPIIGTRIRDALSKWEAEWGPMYDSVVSKVAALPPKTLDWRANINTRLVPVVETWRRAAGKS